MNNAENSSDFAFLGKMGGANREVDELDKAVMCWGDDDAAQLSAPEGRGYRAVSAGERHSCALGAADEITCWGGGPDEKACVPLF